MTIDEKKRYLKSYKLLDNEIDNLLEEREKWIERASSISQVYSLVPKNKGTKDKIGTNIDKVIMIEEEINKKIDELIEIRNNIKTAIIKLENIDEKQVVSLRYLKGMTWNAISNKLYFGYRHVYKIHNRALININLEDITTNKKG